MRIKIEINTGFVSDGGKGSVWESVDLSEETVNEDWEADATTETNSVMDMYLNAIKKTNK